MKRPRDMQRQRVYDAEVSAFGESTCEFDSLGGVEAFVERALARQSIRRRYPRAEWEIEVRDGRGRRRGGGNIGHITMPKWTRSRWYVLHELAHTLTVRPDEAWHGWRFCACYLDLVGAMLGAEAKRQLRDQFKAGRVRYTRPRRATT